MSAEKLLLADVAKHNGNGFQLRPQSRGGTYVVESIMGAVVASRISKRAAMFLAKSMSELAAPDALREKSSRSLRSCRGAARFLLGLETFKKNGLWFATTGDGALFAGNTKKAAIRKLRNPEKVTQ